MFPVNYETIRSQAISAIFGSRAGALRKREVAV